MKTEDMIVELRNVEEKYKNNTYATGETNISLMCSEVADRLEALYRENIGLRGDNYEYKKQKFWLEVYGSTTDDLILETEIEFNSREEAENWADEHFNYDCYAYVTDIIE